MEYRARPGTAPPASTAPASGEAAHSAMAAAAENFSMRPCPMAASRSIQALTAGVAPRMSGQHAGLGAGEPQRVVGGEVGQAGSVAQQIGLLVQHVGQAAQVAAIGGRRVGGRRTRHGRSHTRAVFAEVLGHRAPLLGRAAAEDLRHAPGLEVVAHGSPEQALVGPLSDDARQALAAPPDTARAAAAGAPTRRRSARCRNRCASRSAGRVSCGSRPSTPSRPAWAGCWAR